MSTHLGLDEERRLLWVDSRSQEKSSQLQNLGPQDFRILGNSDRVEVDDAEEIVELRLRNYPLSDRSQIVPDVNVARGLNTGENAFLHRW